MLFILGLGNPGTKYNRTRHNLGHWFVDLLAKNNRASYKRSQYFEYSRIRHENALVCLLKSRHFMNENGIGLKRFLHNFPDFTNQLLIVHDELSLPFGRAKLSVGKSAGGHNGVKSVLINMAPQNSIARLRVGIRTSALSTTPIVDFVLSRFSAQDCIELDALYTRLKLSISKLLKEGIQSAMKFTNTSTF